MVPFRIALLVVGLVLATGSVIQADMIVHLGDTDPVLENWVPDGSSAISRGPVTGDMGYDAWNINDNSTAGGSYFTYEIDPAVEDMERAATLGWYLSGRIRVVDTPDPVDYSISLVYESNVATLNRRFALGLGSDAIGDPIAMFLGGPTVTLTGLGSGYHLYQMVYSPAAGSVDLLVDGSEWISDFAGAANIGPPGSGLARIIWGTNASGSTGNANYALVQFQIVPEPTALGIWTTLGGVGLLAYLRRRRRN